MAVLAVLAVLASTYLIIDWGLLALKALDQQRRDRLRKTYRLSFPADLDVERVAAWVRSISGTMRYSKSGLLGSPTIVFELWASNAGIIHRLKVQWQHADYVIGQLRSLVPGIRVNPEDDLPTKVWVRSVEVGLTHTARPLRIFSAADMAASLLSSVQALRDEETVLIQWVVTPAVPRHMPIHNVAKTQEITLHALMNDMTANHDEIKDRRKKLEEPNVLAVLRIAAVANTDIRAAHLIHRVRASLSATRGPSSRFVKRIVPKTKLQDRITHASGSVRFPIQLSTPEIAALIAWPIGNPNVAGLPPAMSRHLPATENIPRVGRIIGRSNMPGNERPIAVDYLDALKHMHVMGPTGVGKTVLLANMMRQDMIHGYGIVLIESKGDLFHAAMNYVPRERLQDVVVLDVEDVSMPVGFNILDQGDINVVIDEIAALFEHLYSNTHSVWTREVLFHGLRTIATVPGLSFVDLSPLLVPMTREETDWRDNIIRGLTDEQLRNFWQRFENQPRAAQDRITQPVMDRIWQLNARPELRNIIGQSKSTFQTSDVIAQNKILLVNLSGVAKDTASLAGTLIMNSLWHAAKSLRGTKPNFLYLDEFQDFINLPVEPEDMLAKARGFGLGMTLAHQHLAQLPIELKQAVLSNARTKVVFQTSSNDARDMSREFGASVDESDFMHLGQYEAISRIATQTGVSAPVSLATEPPAKVSGLSRAVRQASRTAYGKPVKDVEKQIANRRSAETGPKRRRPSVGSSDGWT